MQSEMLMDISPDDHMLMDLSEEEIDQVSGGLTNNQIIAISGVIALALLIVFY